MNPSHSRSLLVPDPHATVADDVLAALSVDARTGLSSPEAQRRLERHGRNVLHRRQSTSSVSILVDQFRSTVVLLLVAAVVAGVLIGEYVEAVAVALVLVVNTVVGFLTELRAVRSVESLRKLASAVADVERDDRRDELDARHLVPGDIVSVEAGDRVPADIRLIEAFELTTVEAALTGESEPAEKSVRTVGADVSIGDRTNMLYLGTTVLSGRGRGVVVATGLGTEVGRVAQLVDQAQLVQAPLQRGLQRLGRSLSLAVVGLTVGLLLIGLARGLDLREVLEVSIALAVAVVPEGLPAVATLTLAVGMRRMAKRNALVRRLATVETLGSATVIASDKTGTLTTSVMEVVDLVLADGVDEEELWRSAVLANDADIGEDGDGIGDPTEVALLNAAQRHGLDWRELRSASPRLAEDPFDSASMRMAVLTGGLVHAKGAPEVLLPGAEDPSLEHAAEDMGHRALRTLAIARRAAEGLGPTHGTELGEQAYRGLQVLGVVGIQDPPRESAVRAVTAVQDAGIRVVMVTGDQPRTAQSVAGQVGLRSDRVLSGEQLARLDDPSFTAAVEDIDVYARVAPEQKLRLVRTLQARGEIVAVTGDGVNDAPALRQADVGVAMGRAGTDVAREAADIVLTDDNFASIEAAVEEGRRIVANIRHFAQFLFSWHLGIVVIVATAFAAGFTAPLGALMILWNNLIIDVLPSFALALEPGREDAMRRPPRGKDEPILGHGTLRRIITQGLLIATVGLAAYFVALGPLAMTTAQAQTTTFVTVTAAQLLAVFNARSETGSGFVGATRNPYLWTALAITVSLQTLALGFAPLREVLQLTVLPAPAWWTAALLAPLPLLLTQAVRLWRLRTRQAVAPAQDHRHGGVDRPRSPGQT
ncbi:cation-translocating P-type ATPase [Ornithinimicrobium sediminis]|uniref:cation-translocating P-type ATPase n=1 Tax=Ornithinimicrobium sediminis TaxID=2904603 RepID=UPI001E577A35|nr:cation-transporting P-type ATPase [Ornithinimicrobium sediminis]